MNKQLIMALMTGTHRCSYEDDSGTCARCGKVHDPHSFSQSVCTVCGKVCLDHIWNQNGRCDVCNYSCPHDLVTDNGSSGHICGICSVTIAHSYSGGVCDYCGAECQHTASPKWYSSDRHRCPACGLLFPHDWVDLSNIQGCKQCTSCGGTLQHTCPDANAAGCGTCSECGFHCGSHLWSGSSGACRKCGYECKHSNVANNVCQTCGHIMVHPDADYYVSAGKYAGSYIYAGSVNGQKYYRQHAWANDSWASGTYYLLVLNITTPTQFGADYAYTATGGVFTTNVSSVPIGPTLLEGSGKWRVSLHQYTLDGEHLAGKDNYTSSDCADLSGDLP